MTKKVVFKTIPEQINILKSRGLTFNDEAKASRYLLSSNYYNIINGYSKYFQNHPKNSMDDSYIQNANFDEVSHLYFFDKEVKQTIFNSILHAEHHLKSIFAYRFAEAYPNQKYAYLNIECYDPKQRIDALKSISKLSRLIESKINYKDRIITHYAKEYDDVPVWVLVDSLDFGTLGHIIKCLPMKIQNNIARDFVDFINENVSPRLAKGEVLQTWTPNMMNSFIKNVSETRNVCAHNNRLLNFECRSDMSYYGSLHDLYHINSSAKRRSPYTTVICLQCFLSDIEYTILYNSLRKKFRNLSRQLHSISIDDVSKSLGFPKGWEQRPHRTQN